METREIIGQIESAGGILTLDGELISYEVPARLKPLLAELRQRKADVVRILRQRRGIVKAVASPSLPRGVRLVRYEPKDPPIVLDVATVIVDVDLFIRRELAELDARLLSPIQIRGGWGVFTILERLSQAGMELELDRRLPDLREL